MTACDKEARLALAQELATVLERYCPCLCSYCVSEALIEVAAMVCVDTGHGHGVDREAIMAQARDRCELLMEAVQSRADWLESNPAPGPSKMRRH